MVFIGTRETAVPLPTSKGLTLRATQFLLEAFDYVSGFLEV